MTDKNIKRFQAAGYVNSNTELQWTAWEQQLRARMVARGYVPVLELQPVHRTAYVVSMNKFNWQLTIQGVYVGKRKAEQSEGLLHGKLIQRRTASSKSGLSSMP